MIKRFRLEQKSKFERFIIAQFLSDMLDKFISGQPSPVEIGSEQGGIPEWDDIVIHHNDGSYEHLQIKRQTTGFCNKHSDKTKASAKQRKPKGTEKNEGSDKEQEPASSVLDSAFISLANWSKENTNSKRFFNLILMGGNLEIKKELRVSHLEELCKACGQDGIASNALENRDDGPTTQAYNWLTTWCGFSDWTHIINALSRFKVTCVGNDEYVEQQVMNLLGRHFTDSSSTLALLLDYITRETSDVASIKPRTLLRHLNDYLRPEIETWTQYLMSPKSQGSGYLWSVSGIHDVDGEASESSVTVVEKLWGQSSKNGSLRVYADYTPPNSNLTLHSAVLRLALHLQNGKQGLIYQEPLWRSFVFNELGYTLGNSESDLEDLAWIENSEALTCAFQRELKTHIDTRKEAEDLDKSMDYIVWERLCDKLSERFERINDTALMSAMEATWQVWSEKLTNDSGCRRKLLAKLLYPPTEGTNEKHALRIGPKNINLLVNAIETLLLVAVAVGDSEADWESFPSCGKVLSIALKNWSGPSGDSQEVRELSDDSLTAITGPNPPAVVILSGVSASPSELLNEGMADDAEAATSMAAERQPYLLVTRSRSFNQLRKGSLNKLQDYFGRHLKEQHDARQNAIEGNGKRG